MGCSQHHLRYPLHIQCIKIWIFLKGVCLLCGCVRAVLIIQHYGLGLACVGIEVDLNVEKQCDTFTKRALACHIPGDYS